MEDWEDGASAVRGAGGPIKVRRHTGMTEAAKSYLKAAVDRLGVPFLEDYNGSEQEGIGLVQLSADRGVRYSAARGYLRTDPPDNLVVLTHSRATKIVLDGSRATGVEIIAADGTVETIHADHEVIVSAGTFDSPKLLMLSGIGPADHLKEHGISTVADLPVGENLQDHLFVPISFRMDSAVRRPTPLYFLRGLAKARFRRTGWAAGAQFETLGLRAHVALRSGAQPAAARPLLDLPVPQPGRRQGRASAHDQTGHLRASHPDLPGEPRNRTSRGFGPDARAADRPGLPVGAAGHRGAPRGHRDGPRADGRGRRQRGRDRAGARLLRPRRAAQAAAEHRAQRLSPRRHLPDGLGRARRRRP